MTFENKRAAGIKSSPSMAIAMASAAAKTRADNAGVPISRRSVAFHLDFLGVS